MGNIYGAAERHELRDLAATLPGHVHVLITAVADAVRLELPDMTDVEIGRVLVALRAHRFAPVFTDVDGSGSRSMLVAAGLELTRSEWEDQT